MKWTRRMLLAMIASLAACQTKQAKQQQLTELTKTLQLAAKQASGLFEHRSPMVLTLNMLVRSCDSSQPEMSYSEEKVYGHGLIQANITIKVPDPSQPWMRDGYKKS